MSIASLSEALREAGVALRDVVDRAEGSRHRIPDANGLLRGAGLRDPECRGLLLRVGRDGGRRARSRAGRPLGDLHFLRAAQSPALLRRRAGRASDGWLAAFAD